MTDNPTTVRMTKVKLFLRILLLFVGALVIVACGAGQTSDTQNVDKPDSGRILLWHTWTGSEAATLNKMLAAYQDLNPGVSVIGIGVEEEDFVDRFVDRSDSGLGPDLLLLDSNLLYGLVDDNRLRDLAPQGLDLSPYLSTAVNMVSDGKQLFALPFSAHTQALFYNKTLVDSAPETIAELEDRSRNGEVFAQNADFTDSYWGVGAFNGAIVDAQGRLVFGAGGFENWLSFLSTSHSRPGFLFDIDQDALRSAFIDGRATYYVADSLELPSLIAAMGEDAVGIALLPSGPNGGVPRPFLALDALAFSNVSSDDEFSLALDLAAFLTSAQTQLDLAIADLGRVPTNVQMRLTPNLPTNTLTVARQTRLSEPILFVNQPLWRAVTSDSISFMSDYRQVVEGILSPAVMIRRGLLALKQEFGLEPLVVTPDSLCPAQPGSLTLWSSLRDDERRVMEGLAREFESVCSGSTISVVYVPYESISQQFADAVKAGDGPDALFESSRWLGQLVEDGVLLDLTERVAPRILQQFVPKTVAAMRYRDRLYGIPESIAVLALVYNRTKIGDPPIDVQQLAQSVTVDRRIAMPVGFYWGYWGLDSFGGFTFDSYSGEISETAGLVAWLEALQRVSPRPGFDLYFDFSDAEDAFAYEEAAYLITGPWSLARLREEVGMDRISVTQLPNGPVGLGSPMLQTQGMMISAGADPLSIDLAIAFGQFINLPESQQRFLETGSHVTASVTVDLSNYPNIGAFREQARVASLVVENSKFATLEQYGDKLYEAVLIDDSAPADAVHSFVEAVNAEFEQK